MNSVTPDLNDFDDLSTPNEPDFLKKSETLFEEYLK
jgi:hypothetical protein